MMVMMMRLQRALTVQVLLSLSVLGVYAFSPSPSLLSNSIGAIGNHAARSQDVFAELQMPSRLMHAERSAASYSVNLIPQHRQISLASTRSTTCMYAQVPSNEGDSLTESTTPSSFLDRPVLAALDIVGLMVFAAVGKASHAADGSIDLIAVATTAFPFIVSWLATSFFTGVYDKTDGESKEWLVESWKQTAKGWIVAVPLGCVGRGLIKGYVPPAPFVIVTMIATLVVLGGLRTGYSFVSTKSSTD